jgi:molybdate transport system ATP-binding protein
VALEGASVTLGGAAVLREVSLTLRAGDRWALVGANGSGKSTLLRLLRGDQWLDPHRPGRRRFWTPGGAASESPIGARERMVLVGPEGQDEYARAELDLPVEAVIRSGLDGERYPVLRATPARTALVERAAEAMGVAPLLRRALLSLSRGEARRVLVARALAPGLPVLLLDEVCDGLDAVARDALLARLAALAPGITVVTATHREEEIFPGVGRVLRLEGGRVVDDGRPAAGHAPSGRKAAGREAGGRATTGQAASGRGAGGRAVDGRGADDRVAAGRTASVAVAERPARFDLRDVTVRVDGRAILDRVTWSVGAGEAWGVTGPNGAGKSTLLRLLAGEEQPARGSIRRLDLGPRADAAELRLRVGQISPELQARHRFDATGLAVVLSGFLGTVGVARRSSAGERKAAAGVLARLGLARLRRRRFLTCSYGEQRLLLLARALVARPEVLLLDEPFAGLSPQARRALQRTLAAERRRGTTLVLVSHHEDELGGLATRRARLADGRLAVDGP